MYLENFDAHFDNVHLTSTLTGKWPTCQTVGTHNTSIDII